MTLQHPFRLELEVRDYECDLQGIVNNAVYQHYLEHARHQFLKQTGRTFAQWTAQGVHLVVVRAEIDYKAPLRSGDVFAVELRLERSSAVRFGFAQTIDRRAPKPALILNANIICAATDANGRPMRPTMLEPLFAACGV